MEILKLLLADARALILDEPTKVLAPHEVAALFSVFDALKAEGYAILFITHKLREVIACADRITVMRQGRVAGRAGAGRGGRADPRVHDVRRATCRQRSALRAPGREPRAAPGGSFSSCAAPPRRATGSETALKASTWPSVRERSSVWPGFPATARRSWAT